MRIYFFFGLFCLASFTLLAATAEEERVKVIVDRAVAADEPASALEIGLKEPAVIEGLARSLDPIRARHGPVKAVAFSARLVEAARGTADQALLALTLGQHARALERASRSPEAIRALEESSSLYETLGQRGEAAFAQLAIGRLLESQGKLKEARARVERSREQGWEDWTAARRIEFLLQDGSLARVLGRPRDAIRIHEEALALARGSDDKKSEASILNNLALIHTNLADYRQAIGFAHESLKLRAAEDHQGRAISLTNLGLIYETQGDNEEALRTYRAAAAEAGQSKAPQGLAITSVNLGIQLRKMQRAAEAKPYLEEGLRIAEETNLARLRVAARRELGLVLSVLGEQEKSAALLAAALEEAEKIGATADLAETQLVIALRENKDQPAAAARALQLARTTQQPEFEWAALSLLGDLETRAAKPEQAIARYAEAVEVIERLRRRVAGGEIQRQTYFEDKLEPYHKLVELQRALLNFPEAFRWMQQAKARVLLDALALEQREVATKSEAQMDTLRAKLAQAEAEKNSAALAHARAELDQLARKIAAPEILAPIASVEQIGERMLNPQTALLEYLVLPDRTLIAVVTREENKTALDIFPVEMNAEELRREVEEFRSALAQRSLGYERLARTFWDRLLAPAASRLEGKTKLIIAPSGPLWQVPFQVLLDEKKQFAIDRWTLSYAPSASSLLQMTKASQPRASRSILLMSNPANLSPEFPDLPGAENLAAELPRIYEADKAVILNGAAATESAAKKRAAEFGIMHWAVHGVYDSDAPLESHLRLAADEAEDGRLTAREIMNLKFRASLAVLAACETARGRNDAGEGVIGMSWAFFLAGCPAVMASQWKVDAASTAELLIGFHRKLRSGASAASALQEATRDLRKNPAYRHPFYWAPFVIVGAEL